MMKKKTHQKWWVEAIFVYLYRDIKEGVVCPSFPLDIPSHNHTFFTMYSLTIYTFFPSYFISLFKNKITFVAPIVITQSLDISNGKLLRFWAVNGVM